MLTCLFDERARETSALLHVNYHVGCLLWVDPHGAISIDRKIELAGLKLRLSGIAGEMRRARKIDEAGRICVRLSGLYRAKCHEGLHSTQKLLGLPHSCADCTRGRVLKPKIGVSWIGVEDVWPPMVV